MNNQLYLSNPTALLPSAIRRIESTDAVALTFDDGPHPGATIAALDALQQRNLLATFFVLGEKCEQNPEILASIVDQGHEIGIHGYKHFRHIGKRDTIIASLERSIAVITEISGKPPVFFRPPYGWWLPHNDGITRARGLSLVLWSLLIEDYRTSYTPERVIPAYNDRITAGNIVVLHDSEKTEDTIVRSIETLADCLTERSLNTAFIEAVR